MRKNLSSRFSEIFELLDIEMLARDERITCNTCREAVRCRRIDAKQWLPAFTESAQLVVGRARIINVIMVAVLLVLLTAVDVVKCRAMIALSASFVWSATRRFILRAAVSVFTCLFWMLQRLLPILPRKCSECRIL